ncbi:class I SAM-dependent methyltransferase [Leptospira interrogans]|uniref:class I SAM-dependent methyltransferase n=1 Tax=Leptospira interrogans TaxID=173 RepID=UPI00122CF602|nr:class I SAM-dependent methyltransferase [Leptospira interrogans]KAA1266713.1 methyltransferase [Leptospira interrogans serovar Weerasinghe]ULG80186.1 class I SAM-dependent methyltransferase [Leptospira interrogans]UML67821.1 class I SAM-dependent methyltransferase [Leptospira interrogans]UML71143.1 class I SAM-dependent methyltransferase [Leptospira interrogans]
MNHFYLRKDCRLCKSKDLIKVLPLTPTALCDAYVKERKEQDVYPLDLFQCKNCGFVQIECVVDPEIIYRDYIYVTTSSSGLSNHFENYAKDVLEKLNLGASSFVVDIGSNDGTLLSYFKARNAKVLGVEPSTKTAEDATNRGIETLPEFFDPNLARKIKEKVGQADLITVNNLYANIDDLHSFTEGLEYLLSPNGVVAIESSYLGDMVDNMVFDFIYHEHLSYFSILPLIKFFDSFGLRLIHLQHVGTKGGSFRYYWARKNSIHSVSEEVSKFIEIEKEKNMNESYFKKYADRINKVKAELIQELEKSKGKKKIIGYGASATSTTLIYHFGLENYVDYLVDDNPGKIDTYSPGLHIPVKHPDVLNSEGDAVLIVLAWRYFDLIRSKLKNQKLTLICPLPGFKVVR